MNGLSKQDHHLSPQDPLYYAPGSLRKCLSEEFLNQMNHL
jgi:hypothetical protein